MNKTLYLLVHCCGLRGKHSLCCYRKIMNFWWSYYYHPDHPVIDDLTITAHLYIITVPLTDQCFILYFRSLLFVCVLYDQALLTFLRKVVAHEEKNRMSLWNVSMIVAPNLFTFRGQKAKQEEMQGAAGAAHLVRLLIVHQDLLWTVRPVLVWVLRSEESLAITRRLINCHRDQCVYFLWSRFVTTSVQKCSTNKLTWLIQANVSEVISKKPSNLSLSFCLFK